jgi:hypothetical protein
MGEAARDEHWQFGRRIANDPRYFLETLTEVKDIHNKDGIVPFRFNAAQVDYYNRLWCGRGRRDIVGKSRKWGFSTLRIGLGLHHAMYNPGQVFRIVAHEGRTAKELNHTVKSLYESAKRALGKLGLDWQQFLPRLKYDTTREYYFTDTHSTVVVDTAGGRGVGQSDRSDDLYLTEYSIWLDAPDKLAQLIGSLPAGTGRVTIDFNAAGIGNDAYTQYQAAKRRDAEDWNGFDAVFYGINDCKDVYDQAELDERRRILKHRFPAVYPSNDVEMWLKDDKAVFDWDDVQRMANDASGVPIRYLSELLPEKSIKALDIFHGIDAATGGGKSWQVLRTRALWEGELWDIEAPLRVRLPEHEFAERAHERWTRWGGLMTVESNMAQATLLRLKQLGVPKGASVFKRKDPVQGGKSRWGFNTNLTSKRQAIADYQHLLAEGALKSPPSSNIENEARIFEWKDGSGLAGAPDGTAMYDDEIMADLVLVQGMKRERPKARAVHRR